MLPKLLIKESSNMKLPLPRQAKLTNMSTNFTIPTRELLSRELTKTEEQPMFRKSAMDTLTPRQEMPAKRDTVSILRLLNPTTRQALLVPRRDAIRSSKLTEEECVITAS
jgi:hypothetical protein